MPYANIVAQTCNNPIEVFLRFRDFICKRNGTYDYSSTGVGWTLYDTRYAGKSEGDSGYNEDLIAFNDYFVIYSAGTDGQRDMYFQISYVNTYIAITGYLSWNTTTHAGVLAYGVTTAWYNPTATNCIFWAYADLDAFYGVTKYSASYYVGLAGWMPESLVDQTITSAPSTIAAGSSVVVPFTSVPVEWVVGTYLFVKDLSHIERVKITGVSGVNVTFQTFVNSYTAGCKFCLENTLFSGTYIQIAHNGELNANLTVLQSTLPGPSNGDALALTYPSQRFMLYNANNLFGPLSHVRLTINFTSETTHFIETTGYRYLSAAPLYSCLYPEV